MEMSRGSFYLFGQYYLMPVEAVSTDLASDLTALLIYLLTLVLLFHSDGEASGTRQTLLRSGSGFLKFKIRTITQSDVRNFK